MLHEPAAQESGVDHAAAYKTKLGVYMFFIYAIFYVGFVAITTLSPATMEIEVLFGMNLAVVYGFALIIVALIMALVYNHLCTAQEKMLNTGTGTEAEGEEK